MVVDADDLARGQVVQALGQVGVVDQDDLLVGGVGDDLRSGHAELFQHESAFGVERALGGGLGFHALFAHQISHGNGGGDGIGVRIFVTNDIHGHSNVLLVFFPKP